MRKLVESQKFSHSSPPPLFQELLAWKSSQNRKPRLLRGARQVGKSSSIRELGRHFEFFVEVNFDEKQAVHALF